MDEESYGSWSEDGKGDLGVWNMGQHKINPNELKVDDSKYWEWAGL